MKKIVVTFSVLIIALLCSISVFAIDTDDSEKWEYQPYGTGVELTAYKGTQTDVYVPSKITKGDTEYSVLKLGDELFKGNTSLNSATLGEGITEIGASAFEGATNLVCIVTPESLTTIGDKAFSGCTNFNSVILYDTVTSIGENVFADCGKLMIYTNTGTISYFYAISNNISVEVIDIEREPIIVTENDIKYYIANGEAIIVDCSMDVTGQIVIPASIKGVPVVQIGENAFNNCSNITSVVFPDTIKRINSNAFKKCTMLTEVDLPKGLVYLGVNAFIDCSSLKTVEFPDSLKEIDKTAFLYCESITEIELPKSLEKLGAMAFGNCYNLSTITLHGAKQLDEGVFFSCNSVTTVFIDTVEDFCNMQYADTSAVPWAARAIATGSYGTYDTFAEIYVEGKKLVNIEVPSSQKKIEPYTFYYCESLVQIVLPEGIESIGEEAFMCCESLSNINIPSTVKEIGENALSTTPKLTNITIPDGIESIGRDAFSGSGLMSITLPEGLTSISAYCFSGCSNLRSVTIPESVYHIEDGAFQDCKLLTNVKLPSLLKTIGSSSFWGVVGLRSINIPDSVTYINNNAFYPKSIVWKIDNNAYAAAVALTSDNQFIATNVTTTTINNVTYCVGEYAVVAKCDTSIQGAVNIPETVNGKTVTQINSCAFSNASLQSVTLPENLEKIRAGTFDNCDKLTSISIPPSVREIEINAFSGCNNLKTVNISDLDAWCEIDFDLASNPLHKGACLFINGNAVTELFLDKSEIKPYAFQGCSGLSKVVFSDNVKNIGEHAFQFCDSLQIIEFGKDLENIREFAFASCGNTSSPIRIIFNNKLKSIGDSAFRASSVESIVFNEGLESIGDRAFFDCSLLTNANLPNSLVSIGVACFSRCSSIESVNIPEKLIEIPASAFASCSKLLQIKLPDTLLAIGSSAFRNTAIKKVIIPIGTNEFGSSPFNSGTVHLVYIDSPALARAIQSRWKYSVLNSCENPEISYGSSITGTATYIDGSVVSGATVEILYDDGTVKETVTTDANGNYEFTYAEVGRYTIRVTDADGNTASEVVSVKRMNVFDVYVAGETDLVLKKGYNVSGTVTPSTAKVTISDTSGNIFKSFDTTDGTFTFSDIPRGSYIVKAENETGSATTEIYVSNEDVTGITLEIKAQSSTITGDTKIENRDGTYSAKVWVNIDLIDEEGNVVASTKTDAEGKYTFNNVPAGSYNIVALANEMRPDLIGGFDKNHELKGYGHIDVTEFITYTVDTIILREDKVNLTSVSGKVTANGTTQDCQVILTNETGDQIAVFVTDNNGKYSFVNIPDGMYCITAITKNDGMGFAVITIENGVVHGDADIKVAKADKISKREQTLLAIPDCDTKEDALLYKEAILAEKTFYDSLSEKERQQLSEEWIEKLFKLVDLISDSSIVVTGGVKVENEESVISSDEIDDTINFTLTVTETTVSDVDEDGITTDKEYETEKIKDKKGKDKNIVKYYDITFSKDGQSISNIQKQTETNGKLRITMDIPEEYRGHKHYSFIHMHKGEAVTLVDLDNNPNTVTFEIDKFSTFALAYSDVELIGEIEETIYPASITYNAETGKISVSSTETGTLYIATYNGTYLSSVVNYDVFANVTAIDYDFNSNQVAFVWNGNLKPLCEKFAIGN